MNEKRSSNECGDLFQCSMFIVQCSAFGGCFVSLASPNVGCSENPLHKINFNYEG